jgi:hypothetical protein
MLQTVRGVKVFQGCQTHFAEGAFVDGALGIPLYLDGATAFDLDQHTAIVKADAAGGFDFTIDNQIRYLLVGVQNNI